MPLVSVVDNVDRYVEDKYQSVVVVGEWFVSLLNRSPTVVPTKVRRSVRIIFLSSVRQGPSLLRGGFVLAGRNYCT